MSIDTQTPVRTTVTTVPLLTDEDDLSPARGVVIGLTLQTLLFWLPIVVLLVVLL